MKREVDSDSLEVLSDDPAVAYPWMPRKLFREMIRKGVIDAQITPEQVAGLKMLQWVWEDKSLLFFRFMAGSIRKRDREMIIMFPTLAPFERGIVTMFLNAAKLEEHDDTEKAKAFRLTINGIQKYVKETTGIDISAERVRQIRQMAYDYKRDRASSEKRMVLEETI